MAEPYRGHPPAESETAANHGIFAQRSASFAALIAEFTL